MNSLRLTTQGDYELTSAECKAAAKQIEETIKAQLNTFPDIACRVLQRSMGPKQYARLVADLAANIVQTLL